jgi:hypothetical protein
VPSGQGALSDAGDGTRVATCSRALAFKNETPAAAITLLPPPRKSTQPAMGQHGWTFLF